MTTTRNTAPRRVPKPTPTTEERVGSCDVRDAAAKALAALIEERFRARAGGGSQPDRVFALTGVLFSFPTPQMQLDTPMASIDDVTTNNGLEDEDPVLLEDTYIPALGQVLVTTETGGTFQLDVWCSDPVEREGARAALHALFRVQPQPNEQTVVLSQAGRASVRVAMTEEALPPAWRGLGIVLPVRLTLVGSPANMDGGFLAAGDVWRVQAQVEWEAHVVTADDAERWDHVMQIGRVLGPDDDPLEGAAGGTS